MWNKKKTIKILEKHNICTKNKMSQKIPTEDKKRRIDTPIMSV